MPTCKKHNNITGSGVDDSFLCVYCEIDHLRSELAAKEAELEQVKRERDGYKLNGERNYRLWEVERKRADDLQREMDEKWINYRTKMYGRLLKQL